MMELEFHAGQKVEWKSLGTIRTGTFICYELNDELGFYYLIAAVLPDEDDNRDIDIDPRRLTAVR